MSSKRIWKLQDFVAHTGRVQCARLGEKSGQVLATGGDDKRVNIWKVGKPNAMMSLTGHTSAVECLVFDKQEEVLIVGCSGGSMQCWNLEYRKMAGSLSGHRTACSCVEFHPYGEFFASGSNDTNLKIWDLRRKSCIQTYPGHSAPISTIRFSPHGRWVATGGMDNQVKIWDLTAGKQMKDLDLHKAPITSLAFHPKEYLLASGSADRTVKLWSLETFFNVGSTQAGTSGVQAVKFYPEEQAVLSASQDMLRIHPCDAPSTQSDAMDVDWKGLQDMRLCYPEEKLLAVSVDGAQLGIWVADLQRRELSGRGGGAGSVGPSRRAGQAPPGTSAGRMLSPQVPQRPELAPSSVASSVDGADEQAACSADVYSDVAPAVPRRLPARAASEEAQAPLPPATTPAAVAAEAKAAAAAALDRVERLKPAGVLSEGPVASEPPRRAMDPRRPGSPNLALGLGSPQAARVSSQATPSSSSSASCGAAADPGHEQSPVARRIDIDTFSAQHPQMIGVLQRRNEQAKRLKDLWARGNLSSIGGLLTMPQDQAVLCDFSRSVIRKNLSSAINLDACSALLPMLKELMTSKYDDFVATALEFAELLLKQFGSVITETRESCSKIPERQLDIAREGRFMKCNTCYDALREIQKLISEGQNGAASAGRFADFRARLQVFLQRNDPLR